jgi:hypothetical protein
MNPYLIPISFVIVAISLSIYGVYHYVSDLSTGKMVLVNENQTKPNQTLVQTETTKVQETLSCPDSCDDDNPCTYDWCNETSKYKCKHLKLNGEMPGCSEIVGTCVKSRCVSGICSAVKIDNCCGNDNCEAGEDCSNCETDCGACPQQTISQTQNVTQTEQTTPSYAVADHVVISEVLTKSPLCDDKEGFEFIELYNPTSSSISIGEWWIVYYTSTKTDWNDYAWRKQLPSDVWIYPHSYYLIAVSEYWDNCTEKPSWVVPSDYNLGYTAKDGKMTASKGTISLHSSFGNVIDAVGWGSTNLYEGAPATIETGKSLERKPGQDNSTKGNGVDTDNNSNDFTSRETPEPQNSLSEIEVP